MKFQEKEIRLKDGRTCMLVPTAPEYSEQMITYLRETSGETDFLLRYPDEVQYTLEEEQQILERLLDNPKAIMMAAVVDGKVAGNASVNGIGANRKISHRGSMAIALYQAYWGLGIGSAMIEYLSVLAKQVGWHQLDLEVVAENERAIRLYESCGFVASGRRHHALLLDDGTYHDELLMYKTL